MALFKAQLHDGRPVVVLALIPDGHGGVRAAYVREDRHMAHADLDDLLYTDTDISSWPFDMRPVEEVTVPA